MKHSATLAALLAGTMTIACDVDGGSTQVGPASDAAPVPDSAQEASQDAGGAGDDAGADVVEEAAPDVTPSDAPLDAPKDVSFQYDVTIPDADACAVTVVEAEPPSLAIYMILDRSGSMTFANKWETAVSGISLFVDAPGAAGVKVALQFFPLDASHDCAGGGYATPAVDMAALPGNAQSIIDALAAAAPEGTTTPMEGALNGLSQYAASYGSVLPGSQEKVVALLVTDGMPDGDCNNDSTELALIAASAWGGTPPVPTYVMGMSGADFTVLGQIAAAGGTQAAYSVTTGGAAAFLSVLEEIRADAVGCSFAMPVSEAGIVDIDDVRVTFDPSSAPPQQVPRVNDAAACGIGWFFDDDTNPSTIELCPSTCDLMKADPQSSIQLSLGCLGA